MVKRLNQIEQTIQFEEKISCPTEREQVLRDELKNLPDVNLDALPGFDGMCMCFDRLKAIEQLKSKYEQAIAQHSEQLRAYVAKHWNEREIPTGVKALLLVW